MADTTRGAVNALDRDITSVPRLGSTKVGVAIDKEDLLEPCESWYRFLPVEEIKGDEHFPQ
jgi:hypothetical protein